MAELSGNTKQLCSYINSIFPGGALFLIASDTEVKRFFMELTTAVLGANHRKLCAARMIGINTTPDGLSTWVFSPNVTVSANGTYLTREISPVVWLERPHATSSNLLISESLACDITTPLDHGEAFLDLLLAIRSFMPENFLPTVASMACSIMAATYSDVLKKCGCIGVPFLFGEPGSCKSEALKCSLALFGAQKTHFFNSQTTTSSVFDILKRTSIAIGLDDVNERSQDTWEELVIDTYNNTTRGTRSYQSERFVSMALITSNWRFSVTKTRAHTRTITIPFFQHTDEPHASDLYRDRTLARDRASASVGEMIQISTAFTAEYDQYDIPQVAEIFRHSHERFRTTMAVFMYFFLKVSFTHTHTQP